MTKSHIEIKGDKAVWKNEWYAAGNLLKWNMLHYDVQIIGGAALHKGNIAEMATGEGKTLVATFPAFLNALAGRGVHVVTVNDYLARRDSEWMGPITWVAQSIRLGPRLPCAIINTPIIILLSDSVI